MTIHVYDTADMLSGESKDAFVSALAKTALPALTFADWTDLGPPAQFTFVFASALSGPQITTLNAIVADDGTKLVAESAFGMRYFQLTTVPGVNDDNTKGYRVGDVWADTSGNSVYAAVDVSTGTAVWERLSVLGNVAAVEDASVTIDAAEHVALPFQRPFFLPGLVSAGADQLGVFRPEGTDPAEEILVIDKVKLELGTAGGTPDLIVDVHVNGVTIFTTQANRPTIPFGSTFITSVAPDVLEFARDDRFTIDVDQAHAGPKGMDLSVELIGRTVLR